MACGVMIGWVYTVSNLLPFNMVLIDAPLITIGRVGLLGALIGALYKLASTSEIAKKYSFNITDALAIVWASSALLSSLLTDGISKLAGSALFVSEFFAGYCVVRVCYREQSARLRFLEIFLSCMTVVILIAALDQILGFPAVNHLSASIFGTEVPPFQTRFGLVRAMGPLDHAILFGVTSAIGLSFALTPAPIRSQAGKITVMLIGVAMSLSAGPSIAAAFIISARVYEAALAGVRSRWIFALVLTGLALAVPISHGISLTDLLLKFGTFEAESGQFRLLIWQYAWAEVEASPIIGIGGRDWIRPADMPPSIDSLWLVMCVRYGLVCAFFFALMMASTLTGVVRGKMARREANNYSALIITIAVIGGTVHFWGAPWSFLGAICALRVNCTLSSVEDEPEVLGRIA